MEYYSTHINKLIEQLSHLPGIGPKSAQRLAFHIMNMPKDQVEQLTSSITGAREKIRYCKKCCTLTDQELFPHPDSPTIASTSPFFNEKETSLTAWTSPEGPSMLTERFLTSNKCSIFNPFSARVKRGHSSCPRHNPYRVFYSIVQSATFQKIPTP